MSTIIHEPRYTIEQAEYGWDVIDSQTGESVGVCPTGVEAGASAQRLNALADANRKRLAASGFKRELQALGRREGALRLAAILVEPDAGALDALQIQGALLAVKGIGSAKAGAIVRAAGVTAMSRRVRDLTARQRTFIAAELNRCR